jgi:hypothetical protein
VTVAYPILCEAYVLVLLGGCGRKWLAEVLAGAALLNPESTDFAVGSRATGPLSDHPISLTYAVVAAMNSCRQLSVWSFDRHFATLRVKHWL